MTWKDSAGREGNFYTDFTSTWPGGEHGGEIRVVWWDHALVEVTPTAERLQQRK